MTQLPPSVEDPAEWPVEGEVEVPLPPKKREVRKRKAEEAHLDEVISTVAEGGEGEGEGEGPLYEEPPRPKIFHHGGWNAK